MDEFYEPKHRKPGAPVEEPRVQPVPRHAGEYAHESRTLERLGAAAFSIEDAFGITRVPEFGNRA